MAYRPLVRVATYGIPTFFVWMLHSIFSTFYVDFFLRGELLKHDPKMHVSEQYISNLKAAAVRNLVLGQAGYMIWSGLDDMGLRFFRRARRKNASRLQLSRLSVCGPLWALAFALLWLPLRVPYVFSALTFVLLMFFYNKLFIRCLEASQSMLQTNHKRAINREKCDAMPGVFRVFGTASVGIVSCLYDGTNRFEWMGTFRVYNIILALLSSFIFALFSKPQGAIEPNSELSTDENRDYELRENSIDFSTFAFRTLRRDSMKAVVVVYALQSYSKVLYSNFFPIILIVVCAYRPSSLVISLLLIVPYVLSAVLSGPMMRVCIVYGKKETLSIVWLLRVILSFLLLMLLAWMKHNPSTDDNPEHDGQIPAEREQITPIVATPKYGIVFMSLWIINELLTGIVTHLQSSVLADVTDEDTIIFARVKPMSLGIDRLIWIPSKVFESLGIIFTCVCLYFLDAIPLDVPHKPRSGKKKVEVAASVVCLIGLNAFVTSTLMLITWVKWYDLSGRHLAFVRIAMRKRAENESTQGV